MAAARARVHRHVEVRIERLDPKGRGIARLDGQTALVARALPGEHVAARCAPSRRNRVEATTESVLQPSPERVEPRCVHFGTCGGCQLQHLRHDAQVRLKEAGLADALRGVRLVPEQWLEPLVADPWTYRRSARLGVRYVPKKGGALVGFREVGSSRVAVLGECRVLHPAVGSRLTALRDLVSALDARARIPQIGVAAGDDAVGLVVRHLEPLSEPDRERLAAFAAEHGLRIYLQSGGPGTVRPLWPAEPGPLHYRLPEFALELGFEPTDFIQVNAGLNRKLVARAQTLLAPRPNEQVLDLFCGIGNFSLALARAGAQVVGLDTAGSLIARARENARRNGIPNARFGEVDLEDPAQAEAWLRGAWNGLLLDPPRSGAETIVRALGYPRPGRIVYVSCNPATLARDAGILVREKGYRLTAAGTVDMFPHTAHAEAMTLFQLAA